MRDFRDAKAMAQTLRESLTTKAVTVSHSECLELVSRMLGAADWNTLSALLQADRRPQPLRRRRDPSPENELKRHVIRPFRLETMFPFRRPFFRSSSEGRRRRPLSIRHSKAAAKSSWSSKRTPASANPGLKMSTGSASSPN